MSFMTSLFGGGSGSVPPGPTTAQTTGATAGLSGTGTAGADFMKNYGTTGEAGLNSGLNHLNPVTNWFQTIMNGNKAATLNQLQPQIQQVQGGLKTALNTENSLAPRGGGRGAALFDLPFEGQKQIAGEYAGARAAAPAGLQSAATAEGALGASAGGLGSQYGQVSSTANNNLLNYGLNQQQQKNQQQASAGGLFGKLIGGALSFIPGIGPLASGAWNAITGGKKAGGVPSDQNGYG
jgi:hypothetical protein